MLRVGKQKTDKEFQLEFLKKHPYCFFCGKKADCGHHILRKLNHNDQRFDEDNVCPVCWKCHNLIHMKYRKEMEDEWRAYKNETTENFDR